MLSAPNAAGLFYGVQSLLQMADAQGAAPGRALNLPALRIDDQPRFAWRGMMLDESRHFFGKATVKQCLDVMGYLKLTPPSLAPERRAGLADPDQTFIPS